MRSTRRIEVQLAAVGALLMFFTAPLHAEESEASAIIELNLTILEALIVQNDAWLGPMKFMAVFVRTGEDWRLLARSLSSAAS